MNPSSIEKLLIEDITTLLRNYFAATQLFDLYPMDSPVFFGSDEDVKLSWALSTIILKKITERLLSFSLSSAEKFTQEHAELLITQITNRTRNCNSVAYLILRFFDESYAEKSNIWVFPDEKKLINSIVEDMK